MNVSNEKQLEIINNSIASVPENLRNDIEKIYENKYDKIREFSNKNFNKNEQIELIKNITFNYKNIIEKSEKSIKKLIKIYKYRELGDVGIDYDYRYENPDPEELIKKIQKDGPDKPYEKIAKLLKYIFDGDDNLENFFDLNNIKKSFKYWQIYANLIENLLKKDVNLDILRSIDGLGRFATKPFNEKGLKISPLVREKKDGKSQKGKKGKKRKDERKYGGYDDKKKSYDDKKKQYDDKKKQYDKPRYDDQKRGDFEMNNFESTLRKIKFKSENIIYNLWHSTNNELKKKVINMLNPIIDNEFKEKIWNDYINIDSREIKDPITGKIYEDKYYILFIGKGDDNFKSFLKNLMQKIEKTKNKTIKFEKISEFRIYIEYGMINGSDTISSLKKSQIDDRNSNFYKRACQFIIFDGLTQNYSLNCINNLDDLTFDDKTEFITLRESILKLLIGYYAFSLKTIKDFLMKIDSSYVISNISKNVYSESVLLTKLNENEKKIIEKINEIILKYPSFSEERKKFQIKKEELLKTLFEKYKKKLENKKQNNSNKIENKKQNDNKIENKNKNINENEENDEENENNDENDDENDDE